MISAVESKSSGSQQDQSSVQGIPAFRYFSFVYSDGKEWKDSSGIGHRVIEIFIPSKRICYNKIQGVIRATKPRPYESNLIEISLTEDEINQLIAGVKKQREKRSASQGYRQSNYGTF